MDMPQTQMGDSNQAQKYFAAKMNFTTGPAELNQMLKQNKDKYNVIDVRLAKDFMQGHIPGAINIPKDQWESAKGLSKDKMNVVYCYSQVCHLAANAALHFAKQGYPVMELEGGFNTWKEHSFPIEH